MKNQFIFMTGKFLILFIIFSASVFAQKAVVATPKPKPAPKHQPIPDPPDAPWKDDIPFEKSITVDNGVNISLCVSEGNIKINGWERDELRVFISEGGKAGFKVFNKNSNGKPSRLTILGYDPTNPKAESHNQCLSGEQIELDVPVGTNLSNFKGIEGEVQVSIQSVAKAIVKINEGNIELRNIGEKITAQTFDGNISVEDSKGNIGLDTTNGSIFAYNVEPIEDGDSLKAKTTSGSIVLQSSTHSIIEASSISGLIRCKGEIQNNGQYNFKSTTGQILLEIPMKSSFVVEIWSQKGKFSYDVPLKILTEEFDSSSLRRLVAQMGDGGDAKINLGTSSGRVAIKKMN